MFCASCGTENADGVKFCKGCGKPLGNAGDTSRSVSQGQPSAGAGSFSVPKVENAGGKTKSLPVKAIAGIIAAVAVIIAIVVFVGKAGSTINLNDYVVIEASGYDGYGTIYANIDWPAIQQKYGDKIKFTSAAKKEAGDMISMMQPIDELNAGVYIQLNKTNGLSNGEVVNYTWNINEEISKYVNCNLKYEDSSYTVSGLTAVGKFDAFAGLEVTFSGVAPNGKLDFIYTGSELGSYNFYFDKTNGLNNGDTVKATLNNVNMETLAMNLGKVPESMEKEYTVEGLQEYVSNLAEIDDVSRETMKQQAKDVFDAYIANSWTDEGEKKEKLESFTYIGDYFLTAKNSDNSTNNMLYQVYKVQVRDSVSKDDESYNKVNDVFWFIIFNNLLVGDNGETIVDVTKYDTPVEKVEFDSGIDAGWWSTYAWSYYGYGTLDDLYKKAIMAKADTYNHEDNVDESLAPAAVIEEETEPVVADGGYILPDSSEKKLTGEELDGLSKEELEIARNEIYARHGRKFKDEDIQKHFDACDWYEGKIEPDDFKDDEELSDLERDNLDIIKKAEEEKE